MKYHFKNTAILACAGTLLFKICLAEDVEYVQVKKAAVKAQPRVLSHIVATLSYGDKVTIISEQDQWKLAKVGNKQGYVHSSALRSREIRFSPDQTAPDYSEQSSDIDLSSKGMDRLENKFSDTNPDARFDRVNEMEKRSTSISEIAAFAKAGKLNQ